MSLRVFASAFILAYAAAGPGQAAGWEEKRASVIELRQQGRFRSQTASEPLTRS